MALNRFVVDVDDADVEVAAAVIVIHCRPRRRRRCCIIHLDSIVNVASSINTVHTVAWACSTPSTSSLGAKLSNNVVVVPDDSQKTRPVSLSTNADSPNTREDNPTMTILELLEVDEVVEGTMVAVGVAGRLMVDRLNVNCDEWWKGR